MGAALLMTDGSLVTGANVENASYGLSLCAETVAIATASAAGRLREVVAVGVIGGAMDAEGRATGTTPSARAAAAAKSSTKPHNWAAATCSFTAARPRVTRSRPTVCRNCCPPRSDRRIWGSGNHSGESRRDADRRIAPCFAYWQAQVGAGRQTRLVFVCAAIGRRTALARRV